MTNFLKSLFGWANATQTSANASAVRVDAALSGIADDLEQVRGLLRERLGLPPLLTNVPAGDDPLLAAALADRGTSHDAIPATGSHKGNGRRVSV